VGLTNYVVYFLSTGIDVIQIHIQNLKVFLLEIIILSSESLHVVTSRGGLSKEILRCFYENT
jgi:hypothetical protein